MKDNIKFSIGIPAYKGRFIADCINSILAQSYANFELIIVNDASPDNIDKIVHSFSDPRIRYYKNEKNIGAEHVVNNWNKCLDFAIGEYFILMGDDDLMASTYLEEFLKLINKYPELDVYHCRVKTINENSEVTGLCPICPEFENTYDFIWERIKRNRLQFISDFVYRTEELKSRGSFYKLPLAWGSDDLTAYIMSGNKGIAYTSNPVFLYRRSTLTISSSDNIDLKIDAIKQIEKWLKNYLKKAPKNPDHSLLQKQIQKSLPNYISAAKNEKLTNTVNIHKTKGLVKLLKNKNNYKITALDILKSSLYALNKK